MANSLYLRISDTKKRMKPIWDVKWFTARLTRGTVHRSCCGSRRLQHLNDFASHAKRDSFVKNWSDSAWLPSWSKPVCLSPVNFAIHELGSHLSGRITLLFLTKHFATCSTSICMAQVTGLTIETQKFPTGRKMHLQYRNLREKLTLSSRRPMLLLENAVVDPHISQHRVKMKISDMFEITIHFKATEANKQSNLQWHGYMVGISLPLRHQHWKFQRFGPGNAVDFVDLVR